MILLTSNITSSLTYNFLTNTKKKIHPGIKLVLCVIDVCVQGDKNMKLINEKGHYIITLIKMIIIEI